MAPEADTEKVYENVLELFSTVRPNVGVADSLSIAVAYRVGKKIVKSVG